MKHLRHLVWGALCATLFFLLGCASDSPGSKPGTKNAGTSTPPPPALSGGISELIRIGDSISVTFADLPPPGWAEIKDRVKDDGTIALPLGIRVDAAGKTTGQLQGTIEASYVPRYLKRLTVTVKNEERFFFVGGEVRTPGRIIYASGLTVLQAIDSAGGFTEFAKRTKVSLRRVNGQQFVIDCEKALQDHTIDMPVFPGDSINVRKRLW